MKKITIALLLLSASLSSSAIVLTGLVGNNILVEPCNSGSNFSCMMSTTSSLPTLLVGDSEVVSQEELGHYLIMEIGEEEAPVTTALAKKYNVSRESVELALAAFSDAEVPMSFENFELYFSN